MLPKSDLEGITASHIIRKCWDEKYTSAHEIVKELEVLIALKVEASVAGCTNSDTSDWPQAVEIEERRIQRSSPCCEIFNLEQSSIITVYIILFVLSSPIFQELWANRQQAGPNESEGVAYPTQRTPFLKVLEEYAQKP
ncbi:hypothetical protein FHL15_006500 [Xylaria flabelliformis]|uniref:Uncharacterized protein n=1 Tax=Xylaria flabelliformis TaxID=2512241 RepID=A0A553HX98_9PEZI|nr:hypothetical protein FHL15_006500 [Xylaria flabelliformis]